MNDKCCEITCGADACRSCGSCRTEHNEDPVDNCPKQPTHRTTANCQRIKELEERIEALEQLLVCYRVGKNPSEALHRKLEKTKQALKG